MWPYWLMFMLPAVAAMTSGRRRGGYPFDNSRPGLSVGWMLAGLSLTVLVGLRVQVGGDWFNYFHYLDDVRDASFLELLSFGDPAYHFVNWISLKLGWDIFGVNLICGAIFSAGLVHFCRTLPRPWLALAVAVPYVVIVVAMGYTRQGVALGLAMLGLSALGRRSTFWFVIWVFVGATFHKSAVLLLPIAALANTRNRYWTLLWVGVVTAMAYVLLLQEQVQQLYVTYVEAQYESQGAMVRLLMNAVPAVIFLAARRRFAMSRSATALWRWFSVMSLGLLAVLFAIPASTAVDRIALYMLPLQLVVFSHLPSALIGRRGSAVGGSLLVLLYYGAVLFVWLNFASHSQYWVPYRFLPFDSL
jgi:hypothetical protein